MNITIISIILPYPLTSGGAQGIFNMVDAHRKHHQITFIYPAYNNNSPKAQKELQKLWPEVTFKAYPYSRQLSYIPFAWAKAKRAMKLLLIPNKPSFQIERFLRPYGYCITKDFVRFIKKSLQEDRPDIVQVEFYPYLKLADSLPDDVKRVFVHHEIRYVRNMRFAEHLPLTQKDKKLLNTLKDEEIKDLNKYDTVIVLTDIDKKDLEKSGVTATIKVSPFAINTPTLPYTRWNNSVVFIGGFSHTPNQEGIKWFLQEVVPIVTQNTTFTLTIVGKGWSEKYLKTINPAGIPIEVKGFVEDLGSVVHNAISIVPILSGSGMRMKILEAAALGSPIITTKVGIEGIDMISASIVADSPKEFANGLIRLLTQESLRKNLCQAATEIYTEKYSRDSLTKKRENIYNELIQNK